MTKLVHGTVRGLTWFEVPSANLKSATRPKGPVTVLSPLGDLPSDAIEHAMLTCSSKYNYLTTAFPFMPFDTAAEMPGRTVAYMRNTFDDEDVNRWASEHLDVPATVSLRFVMDQYKNTMHVLARTMKNGRRVTISRKLRTDVPLDEALADHLPYLVRNCPRVEEGQPEFTCGAHLAAMLTRVGAHGRRAIEAWVERHRNEDATRIAPLTLSGMVVGEETIANIILTMGPGGRDVHASVRLHDGHTLHDDATGTEIALSASLPEAIRASLAGRTFGEVLDAPWARHLRIRTVRGDELSLRLRAFSEGAGFQIPVADAPTDEEATAQLVRIAEADPDREVSHAAIPLLKSMDRGHLAAALSLLEVQTVLDLEPFGKPGWMLRSKGGEIVVERAPSKSIADFVDELRKDDDVEAA